MLRSPSALKSTTTRSERPISRWISTPRPSCLPREMSRALRSPVEAGSIADSAGAHPFPRPPTPFRPRSLPAAGPVPRGLAVPLPAHHPPPPPHQQRGVSLGKDIIRGEQGRAGVDQARQRRPRSLVLSLGFVAQRDEGAGVDEDRPHEP